MGLASFLIDAQPDGSIGLSVNGQDLSDRVLSAKLDTTVNNLPQLTLTLKGSGQVAGEGVVSVVHLAGSDDAALGEVVASWLRNEDAQSLMEDALRDATPGASPAELILSELGRRALFDFAAS